MKTGMMWLAVAVLGLLTMADVQANSCPGGPFCQQPGPRLPFFRQTPVPAFQAAPWYLYWPYHQHFMTPAPMMGAYYGPPMGAGMMNPYFPPAQVMPAQRP